MKLFLKKWNFEIIIQRISNISDRMVVPFLITFTFILIPLLLEPPDRGGDYAWKWRILHYYHKTGMWFPAEVDHHQVRWSFNLPMAWIAGFFDFHPLSYYILPVIFTIGIVFFVYVISRQLELPPLVAFFIAIAVFCNPLFSDIAGQFEPLLAMGCYALCGVSFSLFIIKKKLSCIYWGVPALCFFLAYGSKVTAVYTCIAVVIFLCFFMSEKSRLFELKSFKLNPAVIVFLLFLLCFFIIETVVLNSIFHLNFGRLEAITKVHLADSGGHLVPENFLDWFFGIFRFCMYEGKRKFLLISLFGGISAGIYLLLKSKKCSNSWKFIILLFSITYFLHSYAVTSIFPFKPVEPHLMRYQVLTLVYGLVICFGGVCAGIKENKGVITKILCCVFCILFCLNILFEGVQITRNILKEHHILSAIKIAFQAVESTHKNIPVLLKYSNPNKNYVIIISYYGFWNSFPYLENNIPETVFDAEKNKYYVLWNKPSIDIAARKSITCYLLDSPKHEVFRKCELSLTGDMK